MSEKQTKRRRKMEREEKLRKRVLMASARGGGKSMMRLDQIAGGILDPEGFRTYKEIRLRETRKSNSSYNFYMKFIEFLGDCLTVSRVENLDYLYGKVDMWGLYLEDGRSIAMTAESLRFLASALPSIVGQAVRDAGLHDVLFGEEKPKQYSGLADKNFNAVYIDEELTSKRQPIFDQIRTNTPQPTPEGSPNYETLVRNFMEGHAYAAHPKQRILKDVLLEDGVFRLVYDDGREALCGPAFIRCLMPMSPALVDLLKEKGYYDYIISAS